MPIDNGVGWGDTTPDKVDGLQKIISQHLAVVKAIYNKKGRQEKSYYFIDCTSGPGYNANLELDMSPLIFLKMATGSGVYCKAIFIEERIDNYSDLIQNINLTPYDSSKISVSTFNGNFKDVLLKVVSSIPRGSYGIIYFDPTSSLDFDFVSRVFMHENLSMIDLLVHISATTMKRLQKPLAEEIKKINKKFWMIRDIYPTGRDLHQMTFLFGMNWNGLKPMKKHRFYSVDSDKGREILMYLSMPKNEYQEKAKAQYGNRVWFS